MKKNLLQRIIIILVVTIASLYYVIGPHRAPRASDAPSTRLSQGSRSRGGRGVGGA